MPIGNRQRTPLSNKLQKYRLSKKQKDAFDRRDLVLGDKTIEMPPELAKDKVARGMWNHLAKLFSEQAFISSADTGIITHFCQMWSAYDRLRQKFDDPDTSFDVQMKIHSQMVRTRAAITGLEDRLFLNPRVRIQALSNIPAKPPESELDKSGFGDI